ncbi:DNA/RNA polymerase [Hortaea werneckii]|nr:DNA/RNA polymerase [Hortaea werneckii]KAI7260986.1 DNA/RNA polymerase [Hortaea werneckii]KAI7396035.1 DNA/RNA polymerase [Hortaea werneckii]KAI7440108.1 DNA/RNA polymerase [Hortaea werneckii]
MHSSSPPFPNSTPLSSHLPRKSKYTWKNLSTLSAYSPQSTLRVIAHIDLDAFYAQCETVRLGLDPAKPLAVQQWQGLIAINYPARAYGLSRHVTITEAKEKCPELVCQHVATWKEGDTQWSYSDDAYKEMATRKVSLDPYRTQSRRILAVIKETLPKDLQRVEKASVDEVFLDLSAHVHHRLLEQYPELQGPPPYDDPSEPLPRPPTTALDWSADALVDLPESESEEDDPDWDDIALLTASQIVRDVRQQIYDQLHFTCSAGLARNKMLSKLGSAYKKPANQTVIRNRAIPHFLSTFKFTKIRNLGGKLGDEIVSRFQTEQISDLLPHSLETLKKHLGDDTGSWLYATLRGDDSSEVNPRTQIKSMLSAKSFRPSINDATTATKWLRIFISDIFSRLVEEGVLENKRRPKTMNLHHRCGQATRSKSTPIPLGRKITEDGLLELAKGLLAQVVVDGRAWPCANLSLSVGGFEEGVSGNKGIGGFLVHGEEARALRESDDGRRGDSAVGDEMRSNKRRKVGGSDAVGGGIARFFGAPQPPSRQESKDSEGEASAGEEDAEDERDEVKKMHDREDAIEDLYGGPLHSKDLHENHALSPNEEPPDPAILERSSPIDKIYSSPSKTASQETGASREDKIKAQIYASHQQEDYAKPHATSAGTANPWSTYPTEEDLPPPALSPKQTEVNPHEQQQCPRCHLPLPSSPSSKTEHEDFHYAQDLQSQLRSPPPPPHQGASRKREEERAAQTRGGVGRGRGKRGRGRGSGGGGGGGSGERGQKRLAFG